MNVLDISDLSEDFVTDLFETADRLSSGRKERELAGKTFVLFFPASSLRTRTTFEKGIRELGGDCVLFPPETLEKREKPGDALAYLANWADGVVVRHPDHAIVEELACGAPIPVINAMTSQSHPCEILSDLYAIRRLRPDYRELVYTFIGPAGNIARSWASAAKVLNLRFIHVCERGNELRGNDRNYAFRTELEDALAESDVVLTDSLPEAYRTPEYVANYQVTLERMKAAKRGAILNPCPPFFRGEEVSADAIDSDRFVGYSFKSHLLVVQQAIVLTCLGLQ
ncbi:ornithine carbamoyltransferase [Paenibacillus flagellatus]|uniref:Ornithine carbamoyltransferase n=1 Tax=Paenibacillus flagellatus TaxID=2211139 RepID=A0A2V5K629_9BACL|nr:ornithine carbamoyltransferase [Paenibacillus flagellatus]PYI54801.1 ornithine carbamoyltransferase [Paenibacillus flagellatus]